MSGAGSNWWMRCILWVLLGGREFTWRVVYDRTWSVAVELSLAGVPMGEAVVDGVSHLFA